MPFDLMIALPPHTLIPNLEFASPLFVTATRLDQLVYSPNCYIKFSDSTFARSGDRTRNRSKLKSNVLSYIFCEVECHSNSRVLTKVSDHVDGAEALTPNHCSNFAYALVPDVYRDRWRQYMEDWFGGGDTPRNYILSKKFSSHSDFTGAVVFLILVTPQLLKNQRSDSVAFHLSQFSSTYHTWFRRADRHFK